MVKAGQKVADSGDTCDGEDDGSRSTSGWSRGGRFRSYRRLFGASVGGTGNNGRVRVASWNVRNKVNRTRIDAILCSCQGIACVRRYVGR